MVVLTQKLLDEITTHIANNLIPNLTTGTGDDAITLTSTDLETPVQIGDTDRNKAAESTTIIDNFFVKSFLLTSAEPDSQPVNLQEFGIQDGLNETAELKAGLVLPVASTKDNLSQWTLRFSGKVLENVWLLH